MHLEGLAAVLEVVAHRTRLPRQLAGLADRHEPDAEGQRHRRGQDEAARLHADDLVDDDLAVGVAARPRQRIHDQREGHVVVEQRGDVLERHPRLGEVGDVAHPRPDQVAEALGLALGHRLLTCCAWSAADGSAGASGRAGSAERLLRRGDHAPGAGGLGATGRPGGSLRGLVGFGMVDVVLVVHRHVLGERRHVRVAVDVPAGACLGAGVLLGDLLLVRLQLYGERGRDEDRRVGAGGHADEQRERQVLESAGAERHDADVEDRADRQQRDDRGVDRAHQRLVHREVGQLGVRPPALAQVLGVLPHLVEDDDRVVEREAEDRQQTGDGRRRDLEPRERVDADRDHDVVDQGDDGGHGHLPLAEVRPDEQHHQDQEDDEAGQGPLRDLLTPAGARPRWRRCRSGRRR